MVMGATVPHAVAAVGEPGAMHRRQVNVCQVDGCQMDAWQVDAWQVDR